MESKFSLKDSAYIDILEGRIPLPAAAVLLGWKTLEVDPQRGFVRGQMLAREEFLNPAGTVQGGILCAMLDGTLGSAAMCGLGPGQYAPTVELKTSFIRAAKLGPIFSEAWVVGRSFGVCFTEGNLKDEQGQLLATGSATSRVFSRD